MAATKVAEEAGGSDGLEAMNDPRRLEGMAQTAVPEFRRATLQALNPSPLLKSCSPSLG